MSNTIKDLVEIFQEASDTQKELFKIKQMFGFTSTSQKVYEDFAEYMQKWKDAQPITDMSIIEKLDDIWNKADNVASCCRNGEDDLSRAQSALEDVPYGLSDDVDGLQTDIKTLMDKIKNPKEQAEADMEDAE